MITEDYVSFEVAKLLKEKGFDSEECEVHYDPYDHKEYEITLQMAMKWLREACAIEISIACFKLDSYRYDIYEINSSYFRRQTIEFNSDEFCSYEEACEAAIKYCLTDLV